MKNYNFMFFHEIFVFSKFNKITIYNEYLDYALPSFQYGLCFKNNISVKPKVFQDSFIWKKVIDEN